MSIENAATQQEQKLKNEEHIPLLTAFSKIKEQEALFIQHCEAIIQGFSQINLVGVDNLEDRVRIASFVALCKEAVAEAKKTLPLSIEAIRERLKSDDPQVVQAVIDDTMVWLKKRTESPFVNLFKETPQFITFAQTLLSQYPQAAQKISTKSAVNLLIGIGAYLSPQKQQLEQVIAYMAKTFPSEAECVAQKAMQELHQSQENAEKSANELNGSEKNKTFWEDLQTRAQEANKAKIEQSVSYNQFKTLSVELSSGGKVTSSTASDATILEAAKGLVMDHLSMLSQHPIKSIRGTATAKETMSLEIASMLVTISKCQTIATLKTEVDEWNKKYFSKPPYFFDTEKLRSPQSVQTVSGKDNLNPESINPAAIVPTQNLTKESPAKAAKPQQAVPGVKPEIKLAEEIDKIVSDSALSPKQQLDKLTPKLQEFLIAILQSGIEKCDQSQQTGHPTVTDQAITTVKNKKNEAKKFIQDAEKEIANYQTLLTTATGDAKKEISQRIKILRAFIESTQAEIAAYDHFLQTAVVKKKILENFKNHLASLRPVTLGGLQKTVLELTEETAIQGDQDESFRNYLRIAKEIIHPYIGPNVHLEKLVREIYETEENFIFQSSQLVTVLEGLDNLTPDERIALDRFLQPYRDVIADRQKDPLLQNKAYEKKLKELFNVSYDDALAKEVLLETGQWIDQKLMRPAFAQAFIQNDTFRTFTETLCKNPLIQAQVDQRLGNLAATNGRVGKIQSCLSGIMTQTQRISRYHDMMKAIMVEECVRRPQLFYPEKNLTSDERSALSKQLAIVRKGLKAEAYETTEKEALSPTIQQLASAGSFWLDRYQDIGKFIFETNEFLKQPSSQDAQSAKNTAIESAVFLKTAQKMACKYFPAVKEKTEKEPLKAEKEPSLETQYQKFSQTSSQLTTLSDLNNFLNNDGKKLFDQSVKLCSELIQIFSSADLSELSVKEQLALQAFLLPYFGVAQAAKETQGNKLRPIFPREVVPPEQFSQFLNVLFKKRTKLAISILSKLQREGEKDLLKEYINPTVLQTARHALFLQEVAKCEMVYGPIPQDADQEAQRPLFKMREAYADTLSSFLPPRRENGSPKKTKEQAIDVEKFEFGKQLDIQGFLRCGITVIHQLLMDARQKCLESKKPIFGKLAEEAILHTHFEALNALTTEEALRPDSGALQATYKWEKLKDLVRKIATRPYDFDSNLLHKFYELHGIKTDTSTQRVQDHFELVTSSAPQTISLEEARETHAAPQEGGLTSRAEGSSRQNSKESRENSQDSISQSSNSEKENSYGPLDSKELQKTQQKVTATWNSDLPVPEKFTEVKSQLGEYFEMEIRQCDLLLEKHPAKTIDDYKKNLEERKSERDPSAKVVLELIHASPEFQYAQQIRAQKAVAQSKLNSITDAKTFAELSDISTILPKGKCSDTSILKQTKKELAEKFKSASEIIFRLMGKKGYGYWLKRLEASGKFFEAMEIISDFEKEFVRVTNTRKIALEIKSETTQLDSVTEEFQKSLSSYKNFIAQHLSSEELAKIQRFVGKHSVARTNTTLFGKENDDQEVVPQKLDLQQTKPTKANQPDKITRGLLYAIGCLLFIGSTMLLFHIYMLEKAYALHLGISLIHDMAGSLILTGVGTLLGLAVIAGTLLYKASLSPYTILAAILGVITVILGTVIGFSIGNGLSLGLLPIIAASTAFLCVACMALSSKNVNKKPGDRLLTILKVTLIAGFMLLAVLSLSLVLENFLGPLKPFLAFFKPFMETAFEIFATPLKEAGISSVGMVEFLNGTALLSTVFMGFLGWTAVRTPPKRYQIELTNIPPAKKDVSRQPQQPTAESGSELLNRLRGEFAALNTTTNPEHVNIWIVDLKQTIERTNNPHLVWELNKMLEKGKVLARMQTSNSLSQGNPRVSTGKADSQVFAPKGRVTLFGTPQQSVMLEGVQPKR